MEDYQLTLRKLAVRDERYIDALLQTDRANATLAGIDERAHAYMEAVARAFRAGASHEEIVGTLITLLPTIGVARVVTAAPNLGLAIGYDVADALELVENGGG
jgi:4-carboxymuconolactone decarboxylase